MKQFDKKIQRAHHVCMLCAFWGEKKIKFQAPRLVPGPRITLRKHQSIIAAAVAYKIYLLSPDFGSSRLTGLYLNACN